MITSSTEISLRLTRNQATLIWVGLDHTVRALLTRELAGQARTSFPFGILQLPVGFDSGTFSAAMMDRVRKLWTKVEPKRSRGGRVRMDAFELRVAALSVRTTQKLYKMMKKRKARAVGVQSQWIRMSGDQNCTPA
jgi:hypothetical protein